MKKLIFSIMMILLSLSVFAQITINPNNPSDSDDLTCNIQSGDPNAYIYKWFLNSEEKSRGNILSNSITNPLETWMCKVYIPPTRYTGITELGEASVTIQQGPPPIIPPTIIYSSTEMPDHLPIPPKP